MLMFKYMLDPNPDQTKAVNMHAFILYYFPDNSSVQFKT